MAQYGLDWSPMLNVLGRLQQDRQFQQAQAENQRQFNAQNMLAQGRFNREGEALARAEAQRGQIRNLLAGGQGFENVPQPVRSIVGVTGDATPIVDYTIAEAKRKSESAVDPSSVREWRHFNAMSPEDQQRYLTMKRAEKYLDTGTGYVRPNPAIPGAAPTPVIAKDLAGKEIAEGEGKNVAKVRADLADNKARLNLALGGLSRLKKSAQELGAQPGLDRVVGGILQATVPNVSTGALNAQTNLDTLKVQISGAVLQAMRDASKTGGAVGQVTEREWPRLENMIANLDPKQGKEQFMKNLAEIVTYADKVSRTLTEAYEADVAVAQRGVTTGQPSGGAAAPAPRRLRFNPQTGGLE